MNTPQKDKLNMFLKVRTFLINNSLALAVLAIIATIQDEFEDIIQKILDDEGEASEDLSGYRDLKEQKQLVVKNQGLKVARAATLYFALTAPDPIKQKKVDLLKSEIDNMRDTDLYARIRKLFAIVDPVKALIVAPDFAAADVTNLNTWNEEYFEVLEAPQDARSLRSSFNKSVDRELVKGSELLEKKLDIAMATFASGNLQLYQYYLSNRLIDDTGSRSELSGFELETFTLAAGLSFSLGEAPAPEHLIYIKNNGPTSLGLCLQPIPNGNCGGSPSRVMVDGEEYLGTFADLGVGLGPGFLTLTNMGTSQITVRAGSKPEN